MRLEKARSGPGQARFSAELTRRQNCLLDADAQRGYGERGCPPSRAVGRRTPGPLRDGRYLRSRPAPLAAILPAVLDGG